MQPVRLGFTPFLRFSVCNTVSSVNSVSTRGFHKGMHMELFTLNFRSQAVPGRDTGVGLPAFWRDFGRNESISSSLRGASSAATTVFAADWNARWSDGGAFS